MVANIKAKLTEYGNAAKNIAAILALIGTITTVGWAWATEKIEKQIEETVKKELVLIEEKLKDNTKKFNDLNVTIHKYRGEQVTNQRSIERNFDGLDKRLQDLTNILLLMNSNANNVAATSQPIQ